ncbi:MAG TPA: hypothetical protein VGH28_21315 [Polyangiaceae bacterium]
MLLLASCHRGPEPFATRATYDAPKSGVRAIVYAKGNVQPGHDLADGSSAVVILCPTTKAGRPFRMDVTPENTAPREPTVTKLTRELDGAAYPMPDPTEIAELADCIDGVAVGPKGTRIAGQTHRLMVASVDFVARAEPTLASCAP